jgi:catechol 2,3-dioxygenase-like lactoylglutathione lyase family enzyme
MQLHALDHVAVRTDDLDGTARFYEALGLTRGPRPPFSMPGYWLYANSRPLVHIMPTSDGAPAGRIDHVAFEGRDARSVAQRLSGASIPFRLQDLPGGSGQQMFLTDPDGVKLEIVFRADDLGRPGSSNQPARDTCSR